MSGGGMNHMYLAKYGDDYNRVLSDDARVSLAECIEIATEIGKKYPYAKKGSDRFIKAMEEILEIAKRLDQILEEHEDHIHDCEWYSDGDYVLETVAKGFCETRDTKGSG